MTSRGWAGLTGAVGLPIGLVVSWIVGVNARWLNPWMGILVLAPMILLGPFLGYALAWFAAAFLEGAMEERQTRRAEAQTSDKYIDPPQESN